jgi:hypothetical protein
MRFAFTQPAVITLAKKELTSSRYATTHKFSKTTLSFPASYWMLRKAVNTWVMDICRDAVSEKVHGAGHVAYRAYL